MTTETFNAPGGSGNFKMQAITKVEASKTRYEDEDLKRKNSSEVQIAFGEVSFLNYRTAHWSLQAPEYIVLPYDLSEIERKKMVYEYNKQNVATPLNAAFHLQTNS